MLNDFSTAFLPEINLRLRTENRGLRGRRQGKHGQSNAQYSAEGGDVNGWGYACTHDGSYYVSDIKPLHYCL